MRWAHFVMCRIILRCSALFPVCCENVKTNKCIMFIQPLVRCVRNIYPETVTWDVDNKLASKRTQTQRQQWVFNSGIKINVEHFAFGSFLVSFGLARFYIVLEYCLCRLFHFCKRSLETQASSTFCLSSRTVVTRVGINKSEFSVVKQFSLNMDGVVNQKKK